MGRYYTATIKYMMEQESKTGNVKIVKKSNKYLVNSSSIPKVYETLNALLVNVYDQFEIVSVSESDYVGFFNQIEDSLKV